MDESRTADPVSLHKEYLIARVNEATRENPALRMVAWVMEANAPETESILLSKAEIHRADDGSISLLVTRDSAKQMLVKWSPKMLDWLESDKPGVIPVIHFARRGMRPTSIEYDAAY